MPWKSKPCPHNPERQCRDCTLEKKRIAEAERKANPGVLNQARKVVREWYAKPENKAKVREYAQQPEVKERNKQNRKKPARRAKAAETAARKRGHPWADGQLQYVIALFSEPVLRCAVCGVAEPNVCLHVDHCHDTGLVRGLLCYKHNYAIGLAGDDSTTLRSLADYVDFHNSRTVRAA